MPTEEDRRYLYDEIARLHDPRAANILMEYLPPVGWGDVATKTDLAKIDARFEQVDARFDRVDARIDQLGARIDSLVPKMIAANLASLMGMAGVVIGAAALLR
jgi:hypothetical protein